MAYAVHLSSPTLPDILVGPFLDKSAATRWLSGVRSLVTDVGLRGRVVPFLTPTAARAHLQKAKDALYGNDLW